MDDGAGRELMKGGDRPSALQRPGEGVAERVGRVGVFVEQREERPAVGVF